MVVAVVGLPPVLLAVWLGGWWLFAVVVVAAVVAVHEFAVLTRRLRPLVLAAYLGDEGESAAALGGDESEA